MDRRDFMGKLAAIAVAGAAIGQIDPKDLRVVKTEGKKGILPKRILGKTGVEVSVLVLGGVAGMGMKPTNEFNPADLANAAIDEGITYLDTAPGYSNGQSELNYGVVMAKRRNDVFLASKTLSRTYDGTMREVEESLKRLQTDHYDLFQVHSVLEKEDVTLWSKPDGMMKAFYKLRDEKVTRFIGVTGHESADAMNRAIDMYDFDTILTTFNPVPRRLPFRESVLQNAIKKNMGIIAMKVMGGGGGALAKVNPAKNINGNWYWDETVHQAEVSDLIRYVLGLPVSCANIGMKSIKELEVNVTAVRDMKPFTKDELVKLETFMA
ncbi:MAG TPA: aldo/keto reductase [Bacteroidales bacterium]|nr:aldo/keto reductase [Bacteroidales bacterium]